MVLISEACMHTLLGLKQIASVGARSIIAIMRDAAKLESGFCYSESCYIMWAFWWYYEQYVYTRRYLAICAYLLHISDGSIFQNFRCYD